MIFLSQRIGLKQRYEHLGIGVQEREDHGLQRIKEVFLESPNNFLHALIALELARHSKRLRNGWKREWMGRDNEGVWKYIYIEHDRNLTVTYKSSLHVSTGENFLERPARSKFER